MERKGEYRALEMRVWQSQLNSLICKSVVEGFFLLAAPNCSLLLSGPCRFSSCKYNSLFLFSLLFLQSIQLSLSFFFVRLCLL